MKILFLDIDGVLNSQQWTRKVWVRDGRQMVWLEPLDQCPICTSNLQLLMESCPDLNIVISSSWRRMHSFSELQDMLEHYGIPRERVLGITPVGLYDEKGRSCDRGVEIQMWLDKNTKVPEGSVLTPKYEVEDFMIIDDDTDMAHLKETNFLQTDNDLGLTIKDVRKLVTRFKGDIDKW